MQLDTQELEELSKTLYVRALKLLPRDIKAGFAELQARETDATGRTVLATMVENIAVAERTNNLLCQDTGIPIYNVTCLLYTSPSPSPSGSSRSRRSARGRRSRRGSAARRCRRRSARSCG